MKSILDVDVMQRYIRMCDDGWLQGWHERNGGNLSYRMKPEEAEQCRPFSALPENGFRWGSPDKIWQESIS